MRLAVLKDIALDCLAGFFALSIVAIVAIALHTISNFAAFLLFGTMLFFCAGLVRASSSGQNPWLKGLVVSMGAIIPVIVVGRLAFAMRASVMLAGFMFLAALVCGAGAQTRKFWQRYQRSAGVMTFLFLTIFVFLAGKFAVPKMLELSNNAAVNEPAPNFALTMLDGTPISSQALRGRVLVLDFWATWCAPCVAEMPILNETYQQYRSNPNVVFLAVNSQWNDDYTNKIRALIQAKRFEVPVALDTSGVAKNFGVNSLPWLIVVDKAGHTRMKDDGYGNADQLKRRLTEKIDFLSKAD